MNTTQEFQIDCIVEADFRIVHEMRLEEFHGLHYFDDSEVEVEKMKVYIDIAGKQFDITDRLTAEELKVIEDTLEPNTDL